MYYLVFSRVDASVVPLVYFSQEESEAWFTREMQTRGYFDVGYMSTSERNVFYPPEKTRILKLLNIRKGSSKFYREYHKCLGSEKDERDKITKLKKYSLKNYLRHE